MMFIKKKKMAFGGEAEMDNEPSVPAAKPDNRRPAEDEYMSDRDAAAYADGGEVEPREIADAIMAKRRRMADGGKVDLSQNAKEDYNNEDQMSYDALRKENYDESSQLADSPMDSAQTGDDREMSEEDENDMVSAIRSRMKAKRGY